MSRSSFPTRNMVVTRLGTPDRTEGSLNDPRERVEDGVRYNEKWLYPHLGDDPAGVPIRVVYWLRYDFVATMVRASEDQSWRPDTSLVESLRDAPSRLPSLDPSHNPPLEPGNRYRAVSDFKGEPDLGGRIES